MSQIFSKDLLVSRGRLDSLCVIIDEDVYDLTKFQDEHPGRFQTPKNQIRRNIPLTSLYLYAHNPMLAGADHGTRSMISRSKLPNKRGGSLPFLFNQNSGGVLDLRRI